MLYLKGMPHSIGFYKKIFLYVTPAPIIVPRFVIQVNPTIQVDNFSAEYLDRKSKTIFKYKKCPVL